MFGPAAGSLPIKLKSGFLSIYLSGIAVGGKKTSGPGLESWAAVNWMATVATLRRGFTSVPFPEKPVFF
jgi:hypothetical protein